MIFAPTDRRHRRKVPSEIRFEDMDAGGNGIVYSVPVIDLRTVDIEHFKASGELDDLLLGVLAHGDTLPGYLDEVAERLKQLTGTSRLDAIEKLVAVLAIGDTRPTGALQKEFEMWMEEVKDRQIVKDIVEIAGRDRLKRERLEGKAEGKAEGAAEGIKRAYAGLIFEAAMEKGLADDEELIEFLVENADEANLKTMVRAAGEMEDLDAFLSEHGLTRRTLGM